MRTAVEYDCPMDVPHTAQEMMAALTERYGTEEITDLAHESGIPRTTIANWAAHPETPLRKSARDHYRRIFEGDENDRDVVATLLENREVVMRRLANVEAAVLSLSAQVERLVVAIEAVEKYRNFEAATGTKEDDRGQTREGE